MSDRLSRELNFPIFLHEEIPDLTKSKPELHKRLGLVIRQLAVDGRSNLIKSCQGENKGWWRTPLRGMQFYLWWTHQRSRQCRNVTFSDRKCIVVRAVRHHDNHTQLSVGIPDDYWELKASDIEDDAENFVGNPWTTVQNQFMRDSSTVRYIYGQPGSGKTAALWKAVETSLGRHVLYLTWSRRLADYAKRRFNTFAPLTLRIDTMDFASFLSTVCESDVRRATLSEHLELLTKIIADARLGSQQLGPWTGRMYALFAELRAILLGRAISDTVDDTNSGFLTRLNDSKYKSLRSGTDGVGLQAVTALLNNIVPAVWNDERLKLVFPELSAANEALRRLNQGNIPAYFVDYDHIAVDEIQDLTLLETAAVVSFCRGLARQRQDGVLPRLLLAGDEGQTVYPTGFEWARLNDLLYDRLGSEIKPAEFKLESGDLRCPPRITEAVLKISYHGLIKKLKPKKQIQGHSAFNQAAYLFHVEIVDEHTAVEFLQTLATLEGMLSLGILSLDHEIPAWIPESLRYMVLTPAQAKGLEYQAVCILSSGSRLKKLNAALEKQVEIQELEAQSHRTDIDQLRVALSRATETLTFVDISPSPEETDLSRGLLGITVTHSPAEWMEIVSATASGTSLDDRVRNLTDEAHSVRDTYPARAWQCIQRAVRLATEPEFQLHATDQDAEQNARTVLLETAARFLVDGMPSGIRQNDVVKAAQETLKVQGIERQAEAFRHLRDWAGHRASAPITLLQAIHDLGREGEWLRQALVSVSQTLNQDLERCATTLSGAERFSQDVEGWLQAIGYKGDVLNRARNLRLSAFGTLLQAGSTTQAQAVLSMMPREDKFRVARNWFLQGLAAMKKQESKKALRSFGNSLAADPNYAEAYVKRGEIHFSTGTAAYSQDAYANAAKHYAKALENLDRAIALYERSGRTQAARQDYEEAKQFKSELQKAIWETNRRRFRQLMEETHALRAPHPAQAWQCIQTAVELIPELEPHTMDKAVQQEARTTLLEIAASFLVNGMPEGIDQDDVVKTAQEILGIHGDKYQSEAFRHLCNWARHRASVSTAFLHAFQGLDDEGEWLRQALISLLEANRGRIRQLTEEARTTRDLYPAQAWQCIQTAVELIPELKTHTTDKAVEQEARTVLLEIAARFLADRVPKGIGQNDVVKAAQATLSVQGDERQVKAFRHLCRWSEQRTSSPISLLQALHGLGSEGKWLRQALIPVSSTLNQALEACAVMPAEAARFSKDVEGWLQEIGYKGDISDRAQKLRVAASNALMQAGHTQQGQTVLSRLPKDALLGEAKEWFDQGVAAMDKQSSKQALKCFDRALAIAPNYAEAYVKRGEIHFSIGNASHRKQAKTKAVNRYTKAIENLDQAIKLYEGRTGQTQEAGQDYEKAKQFKNEVQKAISEMNQDRLKTQGSKGIDVNEMEMKQDSYWDQLNLPRTTQPSPQTLQESDFDLFLTWDNAVFPQGMLDREGGRMTNAITAKWWSLARSLKLKNPMILTFECTRPSVPPGTPNGPDMEKIATDIAQDALGLMKKLHCRPYTLWASDTELMIAIAQPSQPQGPWTRLGFEALSSFSMRTRKGSVSNHPDSLLTDWSDMMRLRLEPGVTHASIVESNTNRQPVGYMPDDDTPWSHPLSETYFNNPMFVSDFMVHDGYRIKADIENSRWSNDDKRMLVDLVRIARYRQSLWSLGRLKKKK